MGECGDHVLDGCLKKIVDEKSSFGNGWRFFILQKVREAGCYGKTSDRAVEGGGVKGEGGRMGVAEVRQSLPDGAV